MSPTLKRLSGVFAVAAFLAACTGDAIVTSPDAGPQFSTHGYAVVTLCKVNDDAPGTQVTFDVEVSGPGTYVTPVTVTAVTFAALNVDTDCRQVWWAGGTSDPSYVTVTERVPAGTTLYRIAAFGDVQAMTDNSVTVRVDAYNGAMLAFKNMGTPTGGEGCTPGYWRNHLEDWAAAGIDTGDDFDTTFGVDYFDPDITMEEAVNLGGGGVRKLARHGSAALLSASHPDVAYPYSAAEVIAMVQAGDVDALAEANELGCDIP